MILPFEAQWCIIFSIITLLVFFYLLLDWFVIDNYLEKKVRRKLLLAELIEEETIETGEVGRPRIKYRLKEMEE
jgi:hypothetical protein